MRKGARISEDEKYRYRLWRIWDNSKPRIMFIMLNPSTADGEKDDPTIRKCITYAKTWGYGGIIVCNLFAYRSTDPKQLKSVEDPLGENNLKTLVTQANKVDKIICAWGNNDIVEKLVDDRIRTILIMLKPKLYILELSKDGCPKHPLYLKSDLKPQWWEKRKHL